MTPAELKARIDGGDTPVLLDVREEWEVDIASLDGARHVPMAGIQSILPTLERDADIVVYCHTGARSQLVVTLLRRSGFERVHNLDGGIHAWAQEIDPGMAVY